MCRGSMCVTRFYCWNLATESRDVLSTNRKVHALAGVMQRRRRCVLPYFTFEVPAKENENMYHNKLMRLCNVSSANVMEAVAKQSASQKQEEKKEQSQKVQVGEVRDHERIPLSARNDMCYWRHLIKCMHEATYEV